MRKKVLLAVTLITLVSGCKTTKVEEKKPEIKQEIVEEVKVPDRVYFGYDRYDLTHKAKKSLDLQVEWLKQDKEIKILVEGHCDERGTKEYNLALGQKRANAVREYLMDKGISGRRIKTVSYGKERPEYLGKGESVWNKNRKAVTIIRN